MRIEIDQSGKVEDTSKATVVAFSNDINRVIRISSQEKKLIQRYFRSIGKPKLFMVLTFCALVYLLIYDFINKNFEIVIDREYPGYDYFIKDQLIIFAKHFHKHLKRDQIKISQIGKKSRAHVIAYNSSKSKVFNKRFKSYDIIKLLKTTKKSGNT